MKRGNSEKDEITSFRICSQCICSPRSCSCICRRSPASLWRVCLTAGGSGCSSRRRSGGRGPGWRMGWFGPAGSGAKQRGLFIAFLRGCAWADFAVHQSGGAAAVARENDAGKAGEYLILKAPPSGWWREQPRKPYAASEVHILNFWVHVVFALAGSSNKRAQAATGAWNTGSLCCASADLAVRIIHLCGRTLIGAARFFPARHHRQGKSTHSHCCAR